MKTVETKKDMIDENESEEKLLSFEELEATVEPLIVPCCEFYQTHERTRENHKKCMIKSTSALTFITDFLKRYDKVETRQEFKTFDSVVCFQSLMFCLEKYQPMGKSFMRMFVYVYFKLKKAHSRFLFDRMSRVNADIAYHEIRKAIRERLESEGLSGPQITELFHSFFSAETYLYASSRKKFFKTKLHFSDDKIKEFEDSLQVNGFVDSLDRIQEKLKIDETEYSGFDDEITPLEKNLCSEGDEPEKTPESPDKYAVDEEAADKKSVSFEYDGQDLADRTESWEKLVNTAQKAFALAKNKREQKYLRCFLTLILVKEVQADTLSAQSENEALSRLAPYIDKPFFQEHWKDDYSAAYQEALEEAARQGKTIREPSFYKAARQATMARYMGLEPSTIATYCVKALNLMTQAGKLLYLVEKDSPPDPVPMEESI